MNSKKEKHIQHSGYTKKIMVKERKRENGEKINS